MCGIVGTINFNNKEILLKMNEVQYHRGPDFSGEYWDESNQVGLAMRRLSIVDLSSGIQPMTNEDGSIVLVFNGEIFNAPSLRKELIGKGHIFKTESSDTEVLVHLYEEYKEEMLNRLNGMFAFTIYDINSKLIFIARDQMGIKPLHYVYDGKRLVFSSELKSLVKADIVQKAINEQAVWSYFSFQTIPAPMTIYENVKVLPAGSYIQYDISENKFVIKEYWNCIRNRKHYIGSEKAVREFVREEVENAIERWTMSDVPLACSLSGGLDSSIIAAVISKKHELYTYSLGFHAEKEYDERILAKELAQKYGTIHQEIVISPEELLDEIGTAFSAMDTPYGGGLPSWFVFQKISGKQKVVFNGTGGDELFGNYAKWLRYEHILERKRRYSQFLGWKEGVKEDRKSVV